MKIKSYYIFHSITENQTEEHVFNVVRDNGDIASLNIRMSNNKGKTKHGYEYEITVFGNIHIFKPEKSNLIPVLQDNMLEGFTFEYFTFLETDTHFGKVDSLIVGIDLSTDGTDKIPPGYNSILFELDLSDFGKNEPSSAFPSLDYDWYLDRDD